MTTERVDGHVDVLIIGAGLSGIGAAAQVRQRLPRKKVAVLEARQASGGTWDLFRYPGIRSDSDMFTFGFKWHPWPGDRALADGDLILDYLRGISEKYGVEEVIRYGHKVTAAAYDSATKRWTVTAETADGPVNLTTDFLWSCSGYYDYDEGHQPQFPGLADYEGTFVHPQHWPEDLDYAGKKVVVIGSGATAVTLVPAMALAEDGRAVEHITMLQRTPTYIMSRPARDPLARALNGGLAKIPGVVPLKRLGQKASWEAVRWANIMTLVGSYQLSRRVPAAVKKVVRDNNLDQLTAREGGKGFTPEEAAELVDKHFTPPYNPWDQRLCAVPDGDFFKAMREGKASVVTDRIKTFTAKGIELESGETLEADIVISATGLKIKFLGGVDLSVDGARIAPNETMVYKGAMASDVPNFLFTFGYTNASWTLKADLVAEFGVKLLSYLDQHGYAEVVPVRDPTVAERPFVDLNSGYIQRALHQLPRQGDQGPWTMKQNYLVDIKRYAASIDDGVLRFR